MIEIIDWAKKYVGVKYKSKGRSFSGLDCWGLVCRVYEDEYGIVIPSYSGDYKDASDTQSCAGAVRRNKEGETWVPCEREHLTYGDIVLLSIAGEPFHTALYVGGEMMLHAIEGTGVVIESLVGLRWKNRIAGYYKHANRNM